MNEHMHNNLEIYITSTIPATQRHNLKPNWVGEAWAEISRDKEMIRRGFKKCGISIPTDGSNDDAINIKGVEGY